MLTNTNLMDLATLITTEKWLITWCQHFLTAATDPAERDLLTATIQQCQHHLSSYRTLLVGPND